METQPPASEEFPWKWADFALPLLLFMFAADAAAICGDQAAALHIWGAEIVRCSQWLTFGVALFMPLFFAGTRLARWRHRITEGLVILCVFSAPLLLLVASSSIPLSRGLTSEEAEDLLKTYPIPTVRYSAGEGNQLRVRREDDTIELREYLGRMGVLRAEGAQE